MIAEFIVNEDGSISNIRIIKDPGWGLGPEVARMIAKMPHWKPGTIDGRPVKVRYTLPVKFEIDSDEQIVPKPRKKRSIQRSKD